MPRKRPKADADVQPPRGWVGNDPLVMKGGVDGVVDSVDRTMEWLDREGRPGGILWKIRCRETGDWWTAHDPVQRKVLERIDEGAGHSYEIKTLDAEVYSRNRGEKIIKPTRVITMQKTAASPAPPPPPGGENSRYADHALWQIASGMAELKAAVSQRDSRPAPVNGPGASGMPWTLPNGEGVVPASMLDRVQQDVERAKQEARQSLAEERERLRRDAAAEVERSKVVWETRVESLQARLSEEGVRAERLQRLVDRYEEEEHRSRGDFDRLTRALADARSEAAAMRAQLEMRPAGGSLAGAVDAPKTLVQQFKELSAMRRLAAEFAEEFGGGGGGGGGSKAEDEGTIGKLKQMADLGETTGELIKGLVQGWRGAPPQYAPHPQYQVSGSPPPSALPPAAPTAPQPPADPQQATAAQFDLGGVDQNKLRMVSGMLQAYYDSGQSPAQAYAELSPLVPLEHVEELRQYPVENFLTAVAIGAELDSTLRRREAKLWLGEIHRLLCTGGAVPPQPQQPPTVGPPLSGARRVSDVMRERVQATPGAPTAPRASDLIQQQQTSG